MSIQPGFFTAHGHRLAYREYGSGLLLIILPGNTASSALHEGDLQYFGQRFHTTALDFLGTGQSERLAVWPEDWWEQGARDALALIDALGEERAILVGTSGGAVAALWSAILAPGRVQAVIADSCGERADPDILRIEIANRAQKTPDQVRFWRAAHGEDWQEVVEADNRICLALADHGGDWFGGRLKEITCPVLFSASLQDDLLPDLGDQLPRMAAQVAFGQAYLCGGGGAHPLMWSRPTEFRAIADAFLSLI